MKVLRIRNNLESVVKESISALQKDGLIVFPSDTVYGLGVDPYSSQAVEKLFAIKSRPLTKAVSVLVDSRATAEKYVYLNPEAKNFYRDFLPGPFTVVSKVKKPSLLSPKIYSGIDTLGVRIPDYLFLRELARVYGRPITATSANISGKSPHYRIDSFIKSLSVKRKSLIDLAIDAGTLPRNKPSTVVDFSQGRINELRRGDLSFGKARVYQSSSPEETKNIAKQLLKDHYRKTKVPLLFALVGELGTGKTTFCQGIGGYFSIDRVNSPTFNISKEYVFAFGVFYHIDTYRLESGEELLDLGFEKMLKKGNIIAIEWAQKAQKLLSGASAKVIWVFLKGENGKRKILVYL